MHSYTNLPLRQLPAMRLRLLTVYSPAHSQMLTSGSTARHRRNAMAWFQRAIVFLLIFFLGLTLFVQAQSKVIRLYKGTAPGSETWTWDEKETSKNPFNTRIVYNVKHPTLTAFVPDPFIANGSAVIVCPGGGYQVLLIDVEGYDIARWLNQRGIAAFVLKYRLGHSQTDDPWTEMFEKINKPSFNKDVASVIRLELEDAKASVMHLRQHAAEYTIDPDRVGMMGFSAGGTVAAALAYAYTKETRPDFAAIFYATVDNIERKGVQSNAPPLFIAAATDDPLVPASNSLHLYEDWLKARQSVELHIYSRDGHGLAEAPSNSWKDRFIEWMESQGWLRGK